MVDRHLTSSVNSRSGGSSRGSRWQERRQKRDQDYRHEEHVKWPDSREGSSQGYRSASYIFEQEQYKKRDQELEHLCKQVRNLDLEVRGTRRRRNCDESPEDSDNIGEFSHQSSLC